MKENEFRDVYEENGKRYIVQYSGYKGGKRVRVCPNCGEEKFLDEEFGFRVMEDGTVRNQSWCEKCRGKY